MSNVQANTKSAAVAYLLWFFLGSFGAHRFYLGRTGSGFGMLGLCVGSMVLTVVAIGLLGFLALFVWWVVDAFLISGWLNEGAEAAPAIAGSVAPSSASDAA